VLVTGEILCNVKVNFRRVDCINKKGYTDFSIRITRLKRE